MGIKGRLTKEHFGHGMPVHAPFIQDLPVYFRNAGVALFQYVTNGEQAAELLPAALELADPPTAVLALIDYPWTTIGPYKEAIQFLVCTHQGRAVQYVPHILVTSDVAMAGGREGYGYPKKIAHIEFVRENEILAGYVERPRGLRICSGVIRPERPLDPAGLPLLPNVCLCVLPPSAGARPAELIEVGSDMRIKELWSASGSCHLTGVSDLDPWHRIPVRQMLSCVYALADFELKEGRVLETLQQPGKVPPVSASCTVALKRSGCLVDRQWRRRPVLTATVAGRAVSRVLQNRETCGTSRCSKVGVCQKALSSDAARV